MLASVYNFVHMFIALLCIWLATSTTARESTTTPTTATSTCFSWLHRPIYSHTHINPRHHSDITWRTVAYHYTDFDVFNVLIVYLLGCYNMLFISALYGSNYVFSVYHCLCCGGVGLLFINEVTQRRTRLADIGLLPRHLSLPIHLG